MLQSMLGHLMLTLGLRKHGVTTCRGFPHPWKEVEAASCEQGNSLTLQPL